MGKLFLIGAFWSMSAFSLMAQDAPVDPAKDAKGDVSKARAEQMKALFIEHLRETDPAKFEELRKMREENPEEFKKQIEELKVKAKENFDKEMADFKGLIDKYRETKTDEALAAVRAKLQEYAQKRLDLQKKRLAEMEKRLDEAKVKIAEEEKGIQKKIDDKLKDIVDGKFPPAGGKEGKQEAQDKKAE